MINLSKSGRINLSKDENGNSLDKIFFGSSWGMIRKAFGLAKEIVDLDFSVILLDVEGNKVDIVYFGHKNSPGVHHYKDDFTGDTYGDDIDNETVEITLSKLESKVEHVFFVLNSSEHYKFDKIPYIRIRIYISPNNKPKERILDPITVLAEYNLKNISSEFQGKESVILGEAYRRNGEWKFKAIGQFGSIKSVLDFPAVCKELV